MGKDRIKERIEKKIDPKRTRVRDRLRERIKKSAEAADVNCVCPVCGTKMPNKAGIPCDLIMCPKCGTSMKKE
jgi:hypothetical protein